MTQYRSGLAKRMIVSHVQSEGIFLKFWAWPLSAAELVREIDHQFCRISSELDAASGFILNNQFLIGLKCGVKSTIRRKWCRARVAAVVDVSTILVQLIDYGIEERVSVADARSIGEYFFHHPPLAVECILADVEPKNRVKWAPEAVAFCEYHLVGQTLSCHAVSDYMKTPVVRVAKQGERQPFVQRLIDMSLARIRDENRQLSFKMNSLEPNSTPHLVKVSCVETPVATNSVQPTQIIPYKQPRLVPGLLIEVTISSINRINEFFCQMASSQEQLKKMSQILNSELDLLPLSLAECQLEMPVCAKCSDDNMWYRAQIQKINNESDIEVFFVDYGKNDSINLRDVCKMIPDLMQYQTQAFKCSLYDVPLPDDQSMRDEMLDTFELIIGQTMTAQVEMVLEDGKYDVILLEDNVKDSINDKLESSFLTIEIVPVSDIEDLFVTHFEAPDSIFTQFKKLDSYNKLRQMQKEMNEYYCNAKNSQFKPKVKNLVCVKLLTSEEFFRARVDVVKDSSCEVSFIDFGYKAEIFSVDIHPMNKKFARYPQFGITCALEKLPVATSVEELSSLMVCNTIQARMLREQNGKWLISLTENFANNAPILELLRQHELVVPLSIQGEKPPDRKDAGTNTLPVEESLLLYVDPSTEKDNNQTVLSKDFEALYNNQRFADVILKLGEHKFPAHKLVLRCRSKVFEAMFEHDMRENRQDAVDLVDMEADTVKDMLRYIYCGKVRPLSPKEALSLYVAADRFDLQELVLYCRKIMLSTVSVDNICDISTVADLHKDKLLMNAVKSLLCKDMKAVVQTDKWLTFAKENPVFCLNLIQTAILSK